MEDKKIKMELKDSFAKTIKKRREGLGLTYVELGSLVGVSAAYLFRLEHQQRRNPSYVLVKKLARVLKLSEEEILNGFADGVGKDFNDWSFVLLDNNVSIKGTVMTTELKKCIIDMVEEYYEFANKLNIPIESINKGLRALY